MVVVASDAQVEPGRLPGGGYLLVDPASGRRSGGWMEFDAELLQLLETSMDLIRDERRQPIALCECAMLPLTLLREGPHIRGRDVLWLVDNTAALSAVVKGASGHPVLEKLVGLYWILTYRFQVRVWIEYVDSESNWSDGISRLFAADAFAAAHGFSTALMQPDISWLRATPHQLWTRSRLLEVRPDC